MRHWLFCFHTSSEIIYPSVIKSRLNQKLGERRNGAELSIWKQQRIVSSRLSLYPLESRASLFALSLGRLTVMNGCYLNSCSFCHKRTPMQVRKERDFYPWGYFLHRMMQQDSFTHLIHVTKGYFMNTFAGSSSSFRY